MPKPKINLEWSEFWYLGRPAARAEYLRQKVLQQPNPKPDPKPKRKKKKRNRYPWRRRR